VETAIGITVSIGLSINKFLAKIASDLDKPRRFAVLGGNEARSFLAPRPVTLIWGVGAVMRARLARDGITRIGDLAATTEAELRRRYGAEGVRLSRLARGLDGRAVTPEREAKSLSAEATFAVDIAAFRPLERRLWLLCEKLLARLKAANLAGSSVTLKLKTADFKLRTRGHTLSDPTQLAAKIFAAGRELLRGEVEGTKFRLIGIAVSHLVDAARRSRRSARREGIAHGSGRACARSSPRQIRPQGRSSADWPSSATRCQWQGLVVLISSDVISPLTAKSP
jgi:DNA polymerase IV